VARPPGRRPDRARRPVLAARGRRLSLASLLVIGGPTASGKTGLAIALAERVIAKGIPAEVISADSRQVFRGLDIGTAKATPAERRRVVHHGLDLVDPDEAFSVADFRAHALAALADLGARGGIGILAGGTGFWLRAVMTGIDTDALPSDAATRAAIEADIKNTGLAVAAARLQVVAPVLASRTDLRNPRRVARGLEIATLRGDEPLPEPVGYDAPVAGIRLTVEPAELARRIAGRARAQFDADLLEEARALRERFDPSLPAFSAIGYRESWAVLDGELTVEAAIALDARRNLQFAKRQGTWFRAEPGLESIDGTHDPVPATIARLEAFVTGLA
jgi:tRNA dimethylallyltransferase